MSHLALTITAILAALNGIVIVAVLLLVTAVRNTPQTRCEIAESEVVQQLHPSANRRPGRRSPPVA